MSTRPRPKPRRAQPVPALSPEPSSSFSPPPPTVSTVNAEDEDSLFLRNRNRTAQAWKKLNKVAEAQEAKQQVIEISDDDNEGVNATPRRRKKHNKKPEHDEALPSWTRMPAKEITLISSDEDEILDLIQPALKGKRRREPERDERRDAKRSRSRSKSITPPPAVPEHARQHAREAIRQIMGSVPRLAAPIEIVEDSLDNIELDPELASIAQEMKSSAAERAREGSAAPDIGGPPIVTIRVKWVPHPKNPVARQQIWGFKVKRHDSFHALTEEVADLAEVITDNVILSYDDKRVFPSATPHSIGLWAEAELEVCDRITYEYLQEARRQRSMSVQPHDHYQTGSPSGNRSPSVILEELSPEPEPEAGSYSTAGEDEEDDKFRLTLRSGKTKDITLTVRPSTTCEAIVKGFLKKAGLADLYPNIGGPVGKKGKGKNAEGPRLMVDGDKLNPSSEIGGADLEDGDLVEVVGL
ncbi:uncharacterized protein C8Q71DRAFT_345732 [Rhodofomes roseus]|uniref:Rad60/SUMO-like domain-containing protein n=1 Tax=Rhodofomes roseus TaxID=34475 RepID=A0ABQ8KTW6_9APHY|nr:uncharacterized protein C8Q71DRAFT_345732 [Rhodofomes roseus]KAH9841722.1 hypothetical protein C8Q71DRAFT_345732 [Rhodofomes roseus]